MNAKHPLNLIAIPRNTVETCRTYIKKDQTRERVLKYRKKHGFSNKKVLGTSSLGTHPANDFKKEYTLIQKEKARMRL